MCETCETNTSVVSRKIKRQHVILLLNNSVVVVQNNVCTETHTHTHTHCINATYCSMHDYHPSCVKAPCPPVLGFSSLTVSSIYHEVTTSGLSSFHKLTEINSLCQTRYSSSPRLPADNRSLYSSWRFATCEPEADKITLLIPCLLYCLTLHAVKFDHVIWSWKSGCIAMQLFCSTTYKLDMESGPPYSLPFLFWWQLF